MSADWTERLSPRWFGWGISGWVARAARRNRDGPGYPGPARGAANLRIAGHTCPGVGGKARHPAILPQRRGFLSRHTMLIKRWPIPAIVVAESGSCREANSCLRPWQERPRPATRTEETEGRGQCPAEPQLRTFGRSVRGRPRQDRREGPARIAGPRHDLLATCEVPGMQSFAHGINIGVRKQGTQRAAARQSAATV